MARCNYSSQKKKCYDVISDSAFSIVYLEMFTDAQNQAKQVFNMLSLHLKLLHLSTKTAVIFANPITCQEVETTCLINC